jgi:hypothetical protein
MALRIANLVMRRKEHGEASLGCFQHRGDAANLYGTRTMVAKPRRKNFQKIRPEE